MNSADQTIVGLADARNGMAPTIDRVFDSHGDLSSGATTDNRIVKLEGIGEPNTVLTIWIDNMNPSKVRVDADGRWTTEVYLQAGQHQLAVESASGQIGDSFEVHVGYAASLPPAPTIEHVTDSQGDVSSNGSTDGRLLTLEGLTQPYAHVLILVDGKPTGYSAYADADGRWTAKVGLEDGPHQISVQDEDGTVGDSFSVNVSIPAPTIDHVADSHGDVSSGSTIDNGALQLEGKGEPNSNVLIYIDGKPVGSAAVDANGHWMASIDLQGGQHKINVQTAEGKASAAFDVNVSVSPPAMPALTIDHVIDAHGDVSPGGSTASKILTLTGTGTPNTSLIITVGGSSAGTVYVDANGQWSKQVNLGQSGQLQFVVHGANGTTSAPFDIYLGQNVAPSSPAPTIDHVTDSRGDVSLGGSTTSKILTLTGTGTPNTSLIITVGGSSAGTVYVDANGQWSKQVNLGQSGQLQFVVHGANGTASAPFDIYLGQNVVPQLPALTIDHVSDAHGDLNSGGRTDGNSVLLKGTGQPNTSVTIFVDGKPATTAYVDANGQWSKQLSLGQNGDHQIKAYGANNAVTAPFDIHVDYVAPAPVVPTIDHVTDTHGDVMSGSTTGDNYVSLKGSGVPNSTVTIYIDGRAAETIRVGPSGQWEKQIGLYQNGDHTIVVKDNAGAASAAFDIHVAYVPPAPVAPTIDQVLDTHGDLSTGGTTDNNYVVLKGTSLPNTSVVVYIDGKSAGVAYVDANGQWSSRIDLQDGQHQITVKATNGVVSDAFDIHVGYVAPPGPTIDHVIDTHGDVSFGGTTQSSNLSLSGTGEPNTIVSILINGSRAYTAMVDANGHWSKDAYVGKDGQYQITVKGANGASSQAFELTIDHSPLAPTIDHVTDIHGDVSFGGTIESGSVSLAGTGQPNTHVIVLIDGVKGAGETMVDANGHWTLQITLDQGQHQIFVQGEAFKTSAPFDITVAPVASAQDNASHDQLSLADVLSAGEADLFAAGHAPDHAQLSVHDMNAAAVDSAATLGSHAMAHDLAALNANLVLPHEQAHAVM